MKLPFCNLCGAEGKCIPDFQLFEKTTGNKRIPNESFCKSMHEKFNIPYDDFHKKVLLNSGENIHSVANIYPDLNDTFKELGVRKSKLPLSVTLMLTEKCNLKCKYCYEVFSGNMKAKSMSRETIKKTIDLYDESIKNCDEYNVNWDFIGGEVFAEFDLLKYAVDYLIQKYKNLNLCPRRYLSLSLCTNGTMFTDEAKKWCEEMRNRIGYFGICISLDGPKHIHDLNRCNSFDRIMENFGWWRDVFPECTIKGTMNPSTISNMYNTVLYFVEDLGLKEFFINPTFEGPWDKELAMVYTDELIKLTEYFLKRPEYRILNNSNVFYEARFKERYARNWCGSGTHMRAIDPTGTIYPCLRAATSKLYPIGHIDTGIDVERLKPFYFYTTHNENEECNNCRFLSACPSCVMEWAENSGDMFIRSTKSCLMTKARLMVSEYFCKHTTEPIRDKDNY